MHKIVRNHEREDFDIIYDCFDEVNIMSYTEMPLVTVYHNTKDYPGKYVARLFYISRGQTNITRLMVMDDTLEGLWMRLPQWMHRLERNEKDDPQIVEVWI